MPESNAAAPVSSALPLGGQGGDGNCLSREDSPLHQLKSTSLLPSQLYDTQFDEDSLLSALKPPQTAAGAQAPKSAQSKDIAGPSNKVTCQYLQLFIF